MPMWKRNLIARNGLVLRRMWRRLASLSSVRYNKRLDRFTLRGRTKVNGQWLLFCLVHNIEKLTHAGYAA